MDNAFSDESDFGDLACHLDNFDKAITHDRNTKLKERNLVKKFFEDIRELRSLPDQKTIDWLGNLPFCMREEAIPLFVDGDDYGDDSVDYQLHPHYTSLELSRTARMPHNELCRLSIDGNILEDPDLVIGISRLFINSGDGRGGRISKWTGYEVFVDKMLALWMVFDRHSIDLLEAEGWYPFSGRLSHPTLQESNDEQHVELTTLEARLFDIACLFPSLPEILNARVAAASEKVQETLRCGEIKVCQVEQSEIGNPQELTEAMLTAVTGNGEPSQTILDLLNKREDYLEMDRRLPVEGDVPLATVNTDLGDQIMSR